MAVIPSLVLTNQLPTNTYTASLVTTSSIFQGRTSALVADGLGNQIFLLDLTSSYALSASFEQEYEISSSYANESFSSTSASFASSSNSSSVSTSASFSITSSHISPSQGAVTDAGPTTGSATLATGYGFATDVEFNNFITTTSSSFQQLNSLLAKLRTAGIIS